MDVLKNQNSDSRKNVNVRTIYLFQANDGDLKYCHSVVNFCLGVKVFLGLPQCTIWSIKSDNPL